MSEGGGREGRREEGGREGGREEVVARIPHFKCKMVMSPSYL